MKLEGNWYLLDDIFELVNVGGSVRQNFWRHRVYKGMASHCQVLRHPVRRIVNTPDGPKQAAGRPARGLLIDEVGAKQLLSEAGVCWPETLQVYAIPYRLSCLARPFLVEEGDMLTFDAQALQRAHPEITLDPSDRAMPIPAQRLKQLVAEYGLLQYIEPDLAPMEE